MGYGRRGFMALAASTVAAPAVIRNVRAQEVTLRLHHMLAPMANAHANVLVPWTKQVEEASNGAIRFRIFPSMQLGGTPPQLYDQAKDGVVDLVWTLPGYSAGRFPRLEVFELPFIATRSGVVNSKVAQDLAAGPAAEDVKDVHLICAWANDQGVFHVNREVHKLEDLKGTKMRFPTRLSGQALEALGAGAIGMPVPQVPESLTQGVIDGAILPWEVVPPLKVDELVQHHTEFPAGSPTFYTSVHLLVMNKASYEGLSSDVRAVLDAHSGQPASVLAGGAWDSAGAKARATAEARGNEIFVLSAEETARWQQATQPVVDAWVKAAPGNADLLKAAQDLVKKYSAA
jgi:TRAP-type C4-dicarboxylate transport system substrate-binding protein